MELTAEETATAAMVASNQAATEQIGGFWSGLGDWIGGVWNSIVDGVSRAIAWIGDKLQGLWNSMKGLAGGLPGMATGGIVKSPLMMVGERGPELAMLPVGTRVFNALETRQMITTSGAGRDAGGPGVTVNLNVPQMVVREEADIERISRGLARLVGRELRTMGRA
jgi:hypothetical protein